MLVDKFLYFSILLHIATSQDETDPPGDGVKTTKKIIDFTTTTFIPKTPEPESTTTTELAKVIFDTPEKVSAEINEAFDDLSRTVNETLENFNAATRDKFEDEGGNIFKDLEKAELYNLYQGRCTTDQLTAYEEFQTALDSVIKLWILKKHPLINIAFKDVYKQWIEPFRRNIEVELVTPITSVLRFSRGQKEKNVACANQYIPQVIKMVETAFTNVLGCYTMSLSYKETRKYAEHISSMYKATAEKFTTCNKNAECYRKYCPKIHLLVIQTTAKATDAMSSIVKNFEKEVEAIPNCAKSKFNNSTYIKLKDELGQAITQCLK